MPRPAGDEHRVVHLGLPLLAVDLDDAARVEEHPQLGAAPVALERQPLPGQDGDDLDRAGLVVHEPAEPAPGALLAVLLRRVLQHITVGHRRHPR
jgi:hypothetical protein